MKILLINPSTKDGGSQGKSSAGHLGLGYLAAVVEAAGYDCGVVDAKFHKMGSAQVLEDIKLHMPSVVGITAMTHEIHIAHDIAIRIKILDDRIVTVVGGPHPTALPERTLLEFPSFDLAVFGEGEETFLEIIEHIDAYKEKQYTPPVHVLGCAYRSNKAVIANHPRPFMGSTKLDMLPFPAWHLFPDQAFPQFSGRGCPYRCAFCCRVLGNKIRSRSPENVIREIEMLHTKYNRTGSWFRDETFGTDKVWTEKFLDLLDDFRNRYNVNWSWKANSRVNLANAKTYKRMYELGCTELDFGIESGNDDILKSIAKDITLHKAQRAINMAKTAGLKTNAFFIIGHPHETWRTALDTVKFAARLNTDHIAVGVMVPYPGTRIWDMAQNNEGGYTLLTEDWKKYDKYFGGAVKLKNLSANQLKLLQSLCYLWFYLRNFKFRELLRFIKVHSSSVFKMLKTLTCRGS